MMGRVYSDTGRTLSLGEKTTTNLFCQLELHLLDREEMLKGLRIKILAKCPFLSQTEGNSGEELRLPAVKSASLEKVSPTGRGIVLTVWVLLQIINIRCRYS